jgi:hypothetical protein
MLELFNKVAEENKIFDEPFIALAEDESKKSSEIDAIELLYGKKKDIKSNEELLQDAHPEPVIVNTSYDLMNSVVEDLHQRQSIMIDIANKNPRVLQTNFRYVKASEDLMQETTKLAFLLENKKQYNLMSAADGVTEELQKVAHPAVLIALKYIAYLGAAIGGTALLANSNPNSQGLQNDIKRAIEELIDVTEDHPKYTSSFGSYMKLLNRTSQVISSLEELDLEFSNQKAQIAALPSTEKMNAVISMYNQLASSKQDEKILALIKECNDLLFSVVETTPNIINVLSKINTLKDSSSTFMSFMKSVKDYVVPNDVKEAINILGVVLDSANQYFEILKEKESSLKTLKDEIAKYHNDNVKTKTLETIPFEARKQE